MAESDTVSLEPASAAHAPLLANLLELYVHDLSEIFPVALGEDGRFGYPKLSLYWSEPDTRWAFLIRCGTRVAGFALVTRGSPASEDPAALDVAEFFVLRAFRRSGVGQRAAVALWDRLPGSWVVRVSEANRAGLPFWRGVIRDYTAGQLAETTRPGRPADWRVFRFASAGPSAPATRTGASP